MPSTSSDPPEPVGLRGAEQVGAELARVPDRFDGGTLVEEPPIPPSCPVPKAIRDTVMPVLRTIVSRLPRTPHPVPARRSLSTVAS
ncbi:hypothetical protein [Saccharopolyspora sp. ASAGF58]|uniref:hypothetical protein n=1 Tax=Saccharopolyspora sp. ASAGF58 TaxID=2719023 RepID=UPI0035302FC8